MSSSLSPLDFAEDRAAELEAVERAVWGCEREQLAIVSSAARLLARLSRRRAGSASAVRRFRPPLPFKLLSLSLLSSERSAPGTARSSRVLSDLSRRARRRRTLLRARGALQTEAWHVKRFEMRELLRMRLPWRASDRAASSCFRALARGATIHDASYLRAMLLVGSAADLCRLLGMVTGLSARTLGRALGSRSMRELPCCLYEVGTWPTGAIAPARLLPLTRSDQADVHLLLFVHVAAAEQAVRVLRAAASGLASVTLHEGPLPLVRFQLRGRRSHMALSRVLRVTGAADGVKASEPTGDEVWNALRSLSSPAPLLPYVALSIRATLSVRPLRPTSGEPGEASGDSGTDVDEARLLRRLLYRWPEALVSAEFLESAMIAAGDSISAAAVAADDKAAALPLILIQEPPAAQKAEACAAGSMAPHGGFGAGWDVIAAAGSARRLWHALVLAGRARAMGQVEVRTIALHSCEPLFPYDFPDTPAGMRWQHDDGELRRDNHARKPPGRRPNYEALQSAHPFAPCWSAALGMPSLETASAVLSSSHLVAFDGDIDIPTAHPTVLTLPTSAEVAKALTDLSATSPDAPPCVLRGAMVRRLLAMARAASEAGGDGSDGAVGGASTAAALNTVGYPQLHDIAGLPPRVRDALPRSLVRVILHFQGKGCAHSPAEITLLSEIELSAWQDGEQQRSADEEAQPDDGALAYKATTKGSDSLSQRGSLIGFVSSGTFNRLSGHGSAIGFCAVVPLLQRLLSERSTLSGIAANVGGAANGWSALPVGVRNPSSEQVRVAIAVIVP